MTAKARPTNIFSLDLPDTYRLIMLGLGGLGILSGLAINWLNPNIYFPSYIYIPVSLVSIIVAILSFRVPNIKSHIFDYASFCYLFMYLGIVFLTYQNRFEPHFAIVLAISHLLFAISFRSFTEFVIFAFASMALLFLCTLMVNGLLVESNFYILVITLLTFSSGFFVWRQERSQKKGNAQSQMLYDLMNGSDEAIILMDTGLEKVQFQNTSAKRYFADLLSNEQPSPEEILRMLEIEKTFLTNRFKATKINIQERGTYVVMNANKEPRLLEIIIRKIRSLHEESLLFQLKNITYQYQQEKDLHQLIAVNQILKDALLEVLLITDPVGRVQTSWKSPKIEYPVSEELIKGQTIYDVLAQLFKDFPTRMLQQAWQQAQIQDTAQQSLFVSEDEGRVQHFELQVIPSRASDNMLIIVRDITEIQETISALHQSAQHYQEIFHHSPMGMIITDNQRFIPLDANASAYRILKKSEEELSELSVEDLLADMSPSIHSAIQELSEGNKETVLGKLYQANGSISSLDIGITPISLSDKQRFIIMFHESGTNSQTAVPSMLAEPAETKIIEAEKALEASEARYSSLLAKMNEGVIVADLEENILFVNDRFCQILGVEKDDVLSSKSYEVLELVDEEQQDLLRQKTELRKQGISDQYEAQLRRPDGRHIWVMVVGSPHKDPQGTIIGSVAILTDITVRKRAEIQLRQKNKELDDFVYKASHDLKGPLASIIGVTNIAREEVKDDGALKYFNLISQSTRRLDSILMDLIDVTRINKATLLWQPIDLSETIHEIIDSLRHLPESKKVNFIVEVDVLQEFVSDKKLLISILQNLITNSITYQDPAKDKPFVHVKVEENKDSVNFFVADNGVGISPKIREKVFDMFYRGNSKSKGSGLGLHIVKSSLEKIEAQYKLESKVGAGTVFSFTLPIKPEEKA